MCQKYQLITITLLSICLFALSGQVDAQKRSDRGSKKAETAGPKRTTRTVPENERVRVITKTEFVKVAIRSNKGYLSVVAVQGAMVTLNPMAGDQAQPVSEKVIDRDGSLNLINLPPGQYKLVIEHPDYIPYSETITVKPALLDTFVALNKMVSIYGGIRVGGAPAGAGIFLDEAPVAASRMTSENQNLIIERIAVGNHRLRVSKKGFVDFDKQIEVLPGQTAFVSAALDAARVSVNLISEPGARIYVGSEEKALVPGSGNVTIQLLPGRQTIRVARDGYQEWSREMTLSMTEPNVTERVNLVPIPNSAEGDWQPPLGQTKWFPQNSGWKFTASGAQAGALVRGDKPVLFDTETNRDFNTYRDFRIEFDVIFSNNKGASWTVRAKDPENYYLFEISTPAGRSPLINFFVSRNGKLELKDSRPVVEKIDKPGDSFHIIFEARGNTCDLRMSITSAPSTQPHRIAIFQDDEFTWGGVGFRGKDLSEFLVQSFFIIPIK